MFKRLESYCHSADLSKMSTSTCFVLDPPIQLNQIQKKSCFSFCLVYIAKMVLLITYRLFTNIKQYLASNIIHMKTHNSKIRVAQWLASLTSSQCFNQIKGSCSLLERETLLYLLLIGYRNRFKQHLENKY